MKPHAVASNFPRESDDARHPVARETTGALHEAGSPSTMHNDVTEIAQDRTPVGDKRESVMIGIQHELSTRAEAQIGIPQRDPPPCTGRGLSPTQLE